MDKYRITKTTYRNGKESFLVERRFLGFLFWYDPFEDGMYGDGTFYTLEDAMDAIEGLRYKPKSEVVWQK